MNKYKKITLTAILFMFSFILCGCDELKQDFHNYQRLESIDDIDNKRIAVVATTSADFCLTQNPSIKLLRYDDAAGAMFALKAKQVDAFAYFGTAIPKLLKQYDGLEVVPGSLFKDSGIAMFGSDEEELCNEFNEFLEEYHKTDDYKKYQENINNLVDGTYEPIVYDTEKFNGHRKIVIASSGTSEPVHYIDKDRNLVGIDLDIFYKFCEAKQYDVEYLIESLDAAILSLRAGKADVCFMTFTLFEAEEYKKTGLFPCDATYDYDIVLIQQKEGEEIRLNNKIPD